MASFNKFYIFVELLGKGVHQLHSHDLRVYASNTAPNASTHTVKADLAEITAQNGYPSGGSSISNNFTQSGGIGTLTGSDVTWTAVGGSFGPLRYVVLYNDTPASPADPLIGWWDYLSSVTIGNGESFTIDFGASVLTIQ